MTPAKLMFARKIRSVFDKLILSKKGKKKKINTSNLYQRKIYFLNYHLGKATWFEGIIKKRTGNMMYCSGKKISFFGFARNLIRHLISPNQDDLSYSSRTSFPRAPKIG